MPTDTRRIVLPDPEQLHRARSSYGPTDAKYSDMAPQPGLHPHVQSMHIPDSARQTITRRHPTEMHNAPVEPMKKKRKSASRTKTGCGTCRRRKKKCDEKKPYCDNCKCGGWDCDGYKEKVPWQGRTATTSGSLMATRKLTTAVAGQPCSINSFSSSAHTPIRKAGSGDSQQSNPRPYLHPLTDDAGVGSRAIAVDEQGYGMPAPRSLHTDRPEPSRALNPSVHPPILPPLWRPSVPIDEEATEANSHSGDHTATGAAMMLAVAPHQRARQLQAPPSYNAPLLNIQRVGNRKMELGEPLQPRVVIGDNVTIGSYSKLHGSGKITVGRNSNVGTNVTITTDPDSHVYIGDNVDIGNGCSIGAGVQIGHGTTVPSGSVVVYNALTD